MNRYSPHLAATEIVRDAGGEIVGRTRLQKIAYLMEIGGLESGFTFEYKHYGPFSEDLATAVDIAVAFGDLKEAEKTAEWGGKYSIFRVDSGVSTASSSRSKFISEAKRIDAVELELAATAAYLFLAEGYGSRKNDNPWTETARRKPQKADKGRLQKAAAAYRSLRKVAPQLPELPDVN